MTTTENQTTATTMRTTCGAYVPATRSNGYKNHRCRRHIARDGMCEVHAVVAESQTAERTFLIAKRETEGRDHGFMDV